MPKKLLLFLCLVTLTFTSGVSLLSAQETDLYSLGERILSFHSDIEVNQDASILITETIQVVAQGEEIRRGIYRDFPTKYKDNRGNNYNVGFEILSVKRDDVAEPYHTEPLRNGTRVYFGQSDVYLSVPGIYTYTFTYRTTRQLGFFETHDELYWNVTGNGWVFPIDRASAEVILPTNIEAKDIKTTGYTGVEGSKQSNLESRVVGNRAYFETTVPLQSYEGLTIVSMWPKGHVTYPTSTEKLWYFLLDNIAWLALLALIAYYSIAWYFHGKDPERGTIIPLYESPDGISPAEIRFLDKMGFDKKCLTASVISMAEKGYLTIEQKTKLYHLSKTGKHEEKLSLEEKEVASELFGILDTCILDNTRSSYFQNAIVKLSKFLDGKYEKKYFVHNYPFLVVGVLLSAMSVLLQSTNFELPAFGVLFLGVWLGIWTVGLVSMWKQIYSSWHTSKSASIFLFFFSIPFLVVEVVVIGVIFTSTSFAFLTFLICLIGVNIFFFITMKRRTLIGEEMQAKIEGFRWFLTVTEKDRINFHNPPELTPELFEKFLPYAFALGVEAKWAEQFHGVFARMGVDEQSYHPQWFHPNTSYAGFGSFASTFGSSFSSAISSASTPPGSSSGGGGGGSSGGGGGGGGGGGW